MTRDEHRAKCIEAMVDAAQKIRAPWVLTLILRQVWVKVMAAAFDALYGIARVVPVEATPKMIEEYELSDYENIGEVWSALSALGDLTNPPEGKP
jgi:hypothetical protein